MIEMEKIDLNCDNVTNSNQKSKNQKMNQEIQKDVMNHIQTKYKPKKNIRFINVNIPPIDSTLESDVYTVLPLKRQKASSKKDTEHFKKICE